MERKAGDAYETALSSRNSLLASLQLAFPLIYRTAGLLTSPHLSRAFVHLISPPNLPPPYLPSTMKLCKLEAGKITPFWHVSIDLFMYLLTCLRVQRSRPLDTVAPEMLGVMSVVWAEEGEKATLNCSFRAWPPPKVTWTQEGSQNTPLGMPAFLYPSLPLSLFFLRVVYEYSSSSLVSCLPLLPSIHTHRQTDTRKSRTFKPSPPSLQ